MRSCLPRFAALLILAGLLCLAPSGWTQAGTPNWSEQGIGSVYEDHLQGHRTASGEAYDRSQLTAAHATLPMGTFVRVTNEATQNWVDLRVNDRPIDDNHVVELSRAAADRMKMPKGGSANVTVRALEGGPTMPRPRTNLARLKKLQLPGQKQQVASSNRQVHPVTGKVISLTPVNGQKPASTTTTPTQPAPIQQGWHVQFGAFSQQSNAQQLMAKLQQSGLQVQSVKTQSGLWKVITSETFPNSTAAANRGSQISRQFNVETAVSRW